MSKNTPIAFVVIILVLGGTFIILSKKPDSTVQNDLDLNKIQIVSTPKVEQNITNSPQNTQKMTELKIEDLKVGTGKEAKSGDTVVMNYLGTLTNGTKFDSSYDRGQPFTTQIGVGQVIQGWDKGVPGMKVGGKRRLSIPSALAYGSRGAGNVIPPDSDLIFEVELVDIK
jgi:FKBP-type peptidyl-prolyl cis-trans isomerase